MQLIFEDTVKVFEEISKIFTLETLCSVVATMLITFILKNLFTKLLLQANNGNFIYPQN